MGLKEQERNYSQNTVTKVGVSFVIFYLCIDQINLICTTTFFYFSLSPFIPSVCTLLEYLQATVMHEQERSVFTEIISLKLKL